MTASGIGVGFGYTPRQPANAGRTDGRSEFAGGTFIMSTVEPARSIEIAAIEHTSLLEFCRDMNLPERAPSR
jgi:hypothetical protein